MIKKTGLENDIAYKLLEKETIQKRVSELAKTLSDDYKGKNPIFVCVLRGSVHFFSDLTRQFSDYCELDFLAVSSYGNSMKNSGSVRIKKDMDMSITNRHVIIVEDIMDSGLTLNSLTALLSERKPASLKVVSLLDKPERRECAITPDYVGFVVPNEFVVGYGLDYAGIYRNLPYIGVLKKEVYEG